jgi:hypothetical protein
MTSAQAAEMGLDPQGNPLPSTGDPAIAPGGVTGGAGGDKVVDCGPALPPADRPVRRGPFNVVIRTSQTPIPPF